MKQNAAWVDSRPGPSRTGLHSAPALRSNRPPLPPSLIPRTGLRNVQVWSCEGGPRQTEGPGCEGEVKGLTSGLFVGTKVCCIDPCVRVINDLSAAVSQADRCAFAVDGLALATICF